MLTRREIRMIAEEVANILREDRERNKPYQYTAEEKAEQLHISVDHLYRIKDKYPHRKKAGTRRLFFQ